MIKNLKTNFWIQSTLNSYSLMFFSLNNLFALVILFVTFFSPYIGLLGLTTVIICNFFSFIIGFNKDEIQKGLFGFNALLLGLVLGYEFKPSFPFLVLFFSSVIMLIMLTAWLKGLLGKYSLPYLTFPFLISYWIISLASTNLGDVYLDENHIYITNEIVKNQSSVFYQFAHSLDNISVFPFAIIYFKTLAGTFFQNSVLGGILIAAGLLYFSRIAFSLSIIGFGCAYLFYYLFGADVNDLNYFLLGSNFIFFAIGIGCYFLIPNFYSYLAVVILTPILMLMLMSFGKILSIYTLRGFTLSFSILTTAFLFSLNQRLFQKYFQLTIIQYYSAEKTIYRYLNSLKRFKDEYLYKISLPFKGEWKVSQAYDGKITHLGEWSKALDFVIVDSENTTYYAPGTEKEHFYCYDKEIIAPYDGYVYNIDNSVEDNDVGGLDLDKNWGNTIVMNHLNGLFSQISHIKKDSFCVEIGQYITKGTVIAKCGNSGRSPEPHIHFQLQTSPIIGATTIPYPISYYVLKEKEGKSLKYSEVPKEGDLISNVQTNDILRNGFNFYPGLKIKFQKEGAQNTVSWEVKTDAYNRTYILCTETNSYAYFVNDGTMFYFIDFDGDHKSLLFHFYLACYRQLLGYYEKIKIKDNIPQIHFNSKPIQFLQDFVAPFYLFTKANYESSFVYVDNNYAPQKLIINSQAEAKTINRSLKKINFELELKDNKITRFTIYNKEKTEIYTCTLE